MNPGVDRRTPFANDRRRKKPSMSIPAQPTKKDDRLIEALSGALERLGATVIVDPRGENLVRALGPARAFSIAALNAHCGDPAAEVRVQGLPNLVHEVAHLVLAQTLDHDHGIDYGGIPFDPETPAGRAVLWEELSCCVVSCAYVAHHGSAFVDAWFAEQLEIQPVFYGLEGRHDEFIAQIRRWTQRCPAELDATLGRAYDGCEALLRWVGAEPSLVSPPQRLTLMHLMMRQRWA